MEATKSYSNIQESRVANYLGWDKVTGSGARDFHPGDVVSADWLGECKTHTSIQSTLRFMKSHWNKIKNEALQLGKYPALITDDGSQRLDRTWVMFPCTIVRPDSSNLVTLADDVKCGVNISFKLESLAAHYSRWCLSKDASAQYEFAIVTAYFGPEVVGLVPISVFHDMFCN